MRSEVFGKDAEITVTGTTLYYGIDEHMTIYSKRASNHSLRFAE